MIVRRTGRQRNGSAAESHAAAYLAASGWRIVARNLRLGRDEIDIVAVDPESVVVVVEVRSLRVSNFGEPEERVDRRKVARLYRALAALRRSESVDAGPARDWRVDLIVVDGRPGRSEIRHLRGLEPPG